MSDPFTERTRREAGRTMIRHADTIAALVRQIEGDCLVIEADRERFTQNEGWDVCNVTGWMREAAKTGYLLGTNLSGIDVRAELQAVQAPPEEPGMPYGTAGDDSCPF